MERDDVTTAAASVLGGVGAFLLLLGALISAGGSRAGRIMTLVGLATLLTSLGLMLLLLLPGGQRQR